MDSFYTERTTCRVCGGPFDPLLDLGTPVLSDFIAPDAPDPPRMPLNLVVCQRCDLVQLQHTIDPERVYRQYWYRSAVNEAMRAELQDVATTVKQYVPRGSILDIGANDGFLLTCFNGGDWTRLGVEPARNIKPLLHAAHWMNDFFPKATKDYVDHSVDAITSIACFYDLDDPISFVAEIDRLMTPDGVWICQFQDLGQQVQTNAFDNIVAEHLCYYTASTFGRLLIGFDLALVAIDTRKINGGSLRFTIRRMKHAQPVVIGHVADIGSRDALDQFAWRVGQYKDQLLGVIDQALRNDRTIDLYAASTKSSMLLQYCGIDSSRIRYAVERSPEKWGRVTSGTRIPVISEEDWRVDPAPCAILGGWQFLDAFVLREAEYLQNGGAFLVPLPSPRVVYGK